MLAGCCDGPTLLTPLTPDGSGEAGDSPLGELPGALGAAGIPDAL